MERKGTKYERQSIFDIIIKVILRYKKIPLKHFVFYLFWPSKNKTLV